jgi:hypothetical protein
VQDAPNAAQDAPNAVEDADDTENASSASHFALTANFGLSTFPFQVSGSISWTRLMSTDTRSPLPAVRNIDWNLAFQTI